MTVCIKMIRGDINADDALKLFIFSCDGSYQMWQDLLLFFRME